MSSNRLTIAGDRLVVEPVGLDKLWSLTRRIDIPLMHVRGASAVAGVVDEARGLRLPGLHLRRKVTGTFYTNGTRQFWNVAGHGDALVIELDPAERFDRLILTVDDPAEEVDAINGACRPS